MAKPSGFASGFGAGFGVGRYRYALAPYVWDTSISGRPLWRLPASAVGGVDLRPLSAQATAGGTPSGYAFCAALQDPGGVSLVTALHMNDQDATSAIQDAWQGAMGYRPQGAKLVDLLWDQLTTGADPAGEAGPKPLMPTVGGQLELHLGGHSLVKRERFRWGTHSHTGKVRDVTRRAFRALWEQTNGSDHCRRVLDYWCRKYGHGDWAEFVPADLQPHVPGRLPHATTITENFTGTGDTLGNLLTWTELAGDIDRSGGEARSTTVGSSVTARADSDLSSTDHYSQALVGAAEDGNAYVSVIGRKDSSATLTFYLADAYFNENQTHVSKTVSGTNTSLGNAARTFTSGTTYTLKVECNGTTIRALVNTVQDVSLTDTSISTGVRCGISGFKGGGLYISWDNFEASDLAAAATKAPAPVRRPWRFFRKPSVRV